MSNIIITPPVAKVVTLDEIKGEVRFETNSENDLLSWYVDVATARAQSYSRRQFITATYQLEIVPTSVVELPASPFQELLTVTDGSGDPVEYELDDTGLRAVMKLKSVPERLVATYTAGFGDDADDVPADARHAVRIAAGHYWRNREISGSLPQAFYDLLASVKIRRFS